VSFNSLGLEDHLVAEVASAGFAEPTTFQSLAIPAALSGHDVFGHANGHPGKAEAYILPLLQHLSRTLPNGPEPLLPRALVLTPTRKATQEIQAATLRYGQHMGIRVIGIFGGVDIEKQIRLLRRRTDVVVATPGRLLDHIARGTVDLSQVSFLVIDEMDRMAEMGFLNDMQRILDQLSASRQSMLFCGKLSPEISAFAGTLLREPVTVDVADTPPPANRARRRFYAAKRETRIRMLIQLLEVESLDRVLVFARDEHEGERIARILRGKGIPAQSIQSATLSAVQTNRWNISMKNGRPRVMVRTHDLAMEGPGQEVDHIIYYDLPKVNAVEGLLGGIDGSGTDMIAFVTDEDRPTLEALGQSDGRRVVVLPFPRRATRRSAEAKGTEKKGQGGKKAVERKPKPASKQAKPLKHRKKSEIVFARRKKPVKKMETFSSDLGGAGWSGY
jgi:ATP-dependent RNA helicase RhlE